MKSLSDKILGPLIRFAHETLGLSPDQVSVIGFLIGMVAAGLVATGNVVAGLIVMALSQIIDGVDGGVARQYGLQSPRGAILETVFDRGNEIAMFIALAYIGEVTYFMVALAFVAILLVTLVEPKSKFDPGAKRFILYFGWLAKTMFSIRGFELAMNVIFFANLAAFAVGTILADYRMQREIDTQAMELREKLRAAGMPLPADDPPSLLSRAFSWF
jgi:phosphatidylglycerophosphate synthase